jgi:ABC-type transport system involved in multi-copper enzyme maturation permease subunit
MTAASVHAADKRRSSMRSSTLMGFGQFFRKEVSEWWASRRAPIIFVITSLLVCGTTIAPWLQANFPAADGSGSAAPLSLDPTVNLVGANWVQWLVYLPILASMGLVAGERDKGTLAWSLSMPLSRTALLAAKWTAGALVYGLAGVVGPMIVGAAVATAAYGALPDPTTIVGFSVALLTLPAFYIGLCIAVGTRITSQAGVAGIAVAVSLSPALAGVLAPGVAQALPPSMGVWSLAWASGADPGWITPVGWAVGMAVVAVIAVASFRRAEL